MQFSQSKLIVRIIKLYCQLLKNKNVHVHCSTPKCSKVNDSYSNGQNYQGRFYLFVTEFAVKLLQVMLRVIDERCYFLRYPQ